MPSRRWVGALSIASLLFSTGAVAQTTVTLQQGLNSYSGAADNWILWSSGADLNKGADPEVDMRSTTDYGLFRFAIFQSEGGPVPDGATINAATFSIYKTFGPDAVFKASRLLKGWTEMGSTWNSTGTGTLWSTPGAQGAGTDVLATADGQGSAPDSAANNCADAVGHDICWLNIDVTAGVQAFSNGSARNFGWLLQQVSSSGEATYKDFNSKDETGFPQYRPRLTVTYTLASTIVTLQQGLNAYAGAADNWILWSSGANLNKGADPEVDMRSTTDYGLFRFAIFQSEGGPVPDGATITSATFSIYKTFGPDAVFKASRLLKGWTEMGSTWNSTGTGTLWSTPGAQGPGTDVLATADGQGSAPDSAVNNCADAVGHDICWLNIDVTAGVQAFANGSAQNFGWLLQQVSSSGDATYKDFNSKDETSFPQYRPKLTIQYNGGCGSRPTASLSATPTSGSAPLAVSFNASASSDGSRPITGLTLTFGDGQQVSWGDKTAPQSHTYPTDNTYTATLTATNACGTSAPVTQTITVGPPPAGCTVPPSTPAATGVAIATFHSMSLYYNPASAPAGDQILVRYRRGSDDPNLVGWKQGHALWYDGRTVHGYHGRGSVVHLQPGIPYVFEVSTDNVNWQHVPGPLGEACPSTWSETFPAGTTLTPFTTVNTTTTSSPYLGSRSSSSRNHVLLANQSGTASGYTVYDFTGTGAVAQTSTASNFFPVVISGSYIVLKGLRIVGGESGILIDPGSHDIVIDSVDVSGYGRDSGTPLQAGLTGDQGSDEDAGIKFPDSSYGDILSTKRIVIQRSSIHNPAFGSHPWDANNTTGAHPAGPTAIMMYPTGGQIVIRYNQTYSTTNGLFDGPPAFNHFHQDGLVQGGCNSTDVNCAGAQGIGPDVDIYKNRVMHYFDDGLETDGDGTNDRVWGNYFDYGGASAVSTTPTYVGPVYVWRNVYNRARMWFTEPWGAEHERLYMMKSGGVGGINGGRRYLYHNTSLQPPFSSEAAPGPNTLGAGFGAGGNGGTNAMQNTVTLNNIFTTWRPAQDGFDLDGASGNQLDYDLTNATCWSGPSPNCTAVEANGYQATTPQYQTGNGWSPTPWNGKYRLQPGTPGAVDGFPILNFSDGFTGVKPDRGAQEHDAADMQFGPGASGS